MAEEIQVEALYIDCECSSMEHTMRFMYWKEKDPSDDRVYVTIHLAPEKSFWKRLVNAIKYMFGYRSRYGDFDEVIIEPTKAKQIVTLLSKLNK